jgi:peptidoglycan/LPS O-acetylase OafA/YrhL
VFATRNAALDGLRGTAVAAVVVNHLRPNALPGGWLGVDIFFVLSGYLITTLLLREHGGRGRLDLGHFYSRRARRLLPALFLLLGAVAIVARFSPEEPGFSGLRDDGFAALGYVANWRFVATGASYFDAFAPSPLRHLWSLAVEEQFYLLWPLVLIVVLRKHGARAVGITAVSLAAASAVAMAVLYESGASVSRIYFGTDTHVHSVLIGCALAAIGPAQRQWRGAGVAALAAVAGIAFAFLRLSGTSPVAYRGGIVAVSLLTAVVIAAAATPSGAGAVGRAFSWKPLCALGLISYGVYLWHWPIIEYVDGDRTGVSGAWLIATQVGLTLVIATASFLLLERRVLAGWPRLRWSSVGGVAVLAVSVVVAGLVVVVPRNAAPYAVAAEAAEARSVDVAPTQPADAGRRGPRRVVVVGDSVAYTLFPGLQANEARSHLYFLTAAKTGCPIDIDATELHLDGEEPVRLDLPAYCDWPRTWPAMIRRTDPDLVVALWGLWDLYDADVDGVRHVVGTPEWTARMDAKLEHALDTLTARGARVVILTTPYIDAHNDRVDTLNARFHAAAARRPGLVRVVDIQPAMSYLAPERWDGIHFTADAATLLGRALVPEIAQAAPPRVEHGPALPVAGPR